MTDKTKEQTVESFFADTKRFLNVHPDTPRELLHQYLTSPERNAAISMFELALVHFAQPAPESTNASRPWPSIPSETVPYEPEFVDDATYPKADVEAALDILDRIRNATPHNKEPYHRDALDKVYHVFRQHLRGEK